MSAASLSGFAAEFSDYDGELPGTIELREPSGGSRVKLVWGSREVNAAVDPALFRLEPPEGVEVRELVP